MKPSNQEEQDQDYQKGRFYHQSCSSTRDAHCSATGSSNFGSSDIVFKQRCAHPRVQGAVLGYPLWSAFFSDSCMAVRATIFEELVYADDLIALRVVDNSVRDDQGHR
eukprot:1060417-Pyramimonas_sp.AAC.1